MKRRNDRFGAMGALAGLNGLAGAKPFIQTQLHPLELQDFILRIEAMASGRPGGVREAVAALPDTERRRRDASYICHDPYGKQGAFSG